MAESMATAIYIIVLVGWVWMMCLVLRCCREGDDQDIFDLEEINISAMHDKPTTIVDGQPVNFARVQRLVDSPLGLAGRGGTAEGNSRGSTSSSEHRDYLKEEPRVDSLELTEATNPALALPSAEEVWSPILALRTFVEPLASRASAALRNIQVSFHDPEDAAGAGAEAGGRGGADGDRGLAVEGGGAKMIAVTAVLAADAEQGGISRREGHRQEEQMSIGGTAATEDLREAGRVILPGSNGLEFVVVSSRHGVFEGATAAEPAPSPEEKVQ